VKYIKAKFVSVTNALKQMSWSKKILLIMVVMAFVATGSIIVTGQPGFCNSCHIMNPYYDSWQTSAHSEVNCLDCHLQPGFAGYVKGKINGLAQAVACMVGRVGTKPNATIEELSCLRAECHNTDELVSEYIDYNGTNFTHNKHIAQTVDGIKISCGLCHSRFEGDEHFNVNNDVCFTCHFLKANESGSKLVQTSCQDCHKVPDKVIERGWVTVDHAEFVSYKASCEDSCHKKEIEKQSQVFDTVCLNCHSYRKSQQVDSAELHEIHTNCDKVECFACHGKVVHGPIKSISIVAMMDCKNCHSDTHEVQRNIYTAQHHPQNGDSERILSPMFLTHVECTGCHIEQVQKNPGALDSFGEVAKAVPRACDRCHEEGTGQQSIPLWQREIKGLYEKISYRLDRLEERARLEADEQLAQKFNSKAEQARSILESVSSDGSWGVHNFKYTEAMLRKADEIITEAQ
jgi:hypothetical protein